MIEALAHTTPLTRAGLAACTAVGGFLAWNAAASGILAWKLGLPDADPLRAWWTYWQAYPLPQPRLGDTLAQMAAENRAVRRALLLSATLPTLALACAAVNGARAMWGWNWPRLAHDDARWATWRDLRAAGFSSRTGQHLGRVGGRWLRSGTGRTRRNTAVIAPTQSGKDVSFGIPAGLNDATDRTSVVYFDPKFQAFTRTAGWQRAISANVVLFSPLDEGGRTAQYNPLSYIRRNPDGSPTVDTWGDCEGIANRQIASTTGDKYSYWTNNARIAYTAMIAFQSETDGADFSIPGVIDLMFRQDAAAYITRCLDERREVGRPYSAPCATNLRDFLNGDDQFRDSIRKTIKAELGIFFNPRVRAAVSGNTFDLRRVMRERTALYVGVNFSDIAKLRPLTSLLFQHLVDVNSRGLPGADPSVTHEMLLVLNEFTNMGVMPDLAAAFSTSLEYGIRMMPMFQSPSQLKAVYGDMAAPILDNCKDKIVLGGLQDGPFREQMSKDLGTVKAQRKSGPIAWLSRKDATVSEAATPLMSAHAILLLPPHQALLMHGGSRGVLLNRVRYYATQPFKRRSSLPPPAVPAIVVDLRYDEAYDLAVPPHLEPGGPPAPSPAAAKPASPRQPADPALAADVTRAESAMTLAQAENTLAALPASVDLSRFAPTPEGAQKLIDRVVHGVPAAKPATKGAKPARKPRRAA